MFDFLSRSWAAICRWFLPKPSVCKQNPAKQTVPLTAPPVPNAVPPPASSQVGQAHLEMGAAEPPQYRKKASLLSYQERRFYTVLQQVVDNRYFIFTKVRMADVIWLANEPQNRKYHNNQVLCKHLDFVLCDRRDFSPLMVIELDDSSHSRYDRQASDAFKNKACNMAKISLLRIEAKSKYDLVVLEKAIEALPCSPVEVA